MNTGLKSYTKQLTHNIGSVANVSVNVNPEDANLLITLPLLKTIGLSPIELSLIYNHQNSNVAGLFGKGMKLNLYSKLVVSSNKITVENADGSIDEYLQVNGYKNIENQTTIEKVFDDEYEMSYHYKMTDKYGNFKLYSPLNLEYPYAIQTIGTDVFTLDFIASTKSISNNKGDVIEFTCIDGVVDNIIYKHYDTQLYLIRIRYRDDNNLYLLEHFKDNVVIASSTIEYSTNKIIVSDSVLNYRIQYNLNGNKVIYFVESYSYQFDSSRATTITYETHKTTITDNLGNKRYVFFDNHNLPLFEMDNEGNVVETEYDVSTKALTAQSSVVRTKNLPTNLFPGQAVNYFTKESGVTQTGPVSITNPFFKNILGSTVYRLTGTGKVSYSLSANGLATDNLQAIIWGRQLSAFTDQSSVVVTLTADSSDSDIFKKTIVDDNFDLMTLGVSALKSYKTIVLTIELKGNASIEIGGIQILKKDFGAFFEYDENGNTTGQVSGSGSNNISYNESNLANAVQGADSTMYDLQYDNKGNIVKAKTAYGVAIENEYDNYNNLTKNRVVNDSIILETEKVYSSNGLLASEKDELGNQTSYLYDSFGKVVQVTDALNTITKYSYDAYDNLKQIILQKDSNTVSSNYSYDSKQRIESISLRNGTDYDFEYDDKDNITKVLLNNNTIFKYEYDEDGALILQQYGENGDAYRFEYNSKKELIKIFYVAPGKVESLRYVYEYNNLNQLANIKSATGVILNSYVYDVDSKVIQISSTNEVIDYQYDNLGNVNEKKTLVNGNKIYQSFDNIARSKGSNPESIIDTLESCNDACVVTFISDAKAKWRSIPLECYTKDGTLSNVTLSKDGIIPCAVLSSSSSKRITYLLPNSQMPDTSGMVAFWFKPTNISTKQYLFSQKRRAGNGFIGAYIQSSRIYVEVINSSGEKNTLITSNSLVNKNQWNFFALDYIYRNDTGYSGDYINQIDLILNSQRQTFKDKTGTYYFDQGTDVVYHIGHSYDNSSYSYFLMGKIALVMMGNNRCLDIKKITDYYRITKDYIIDNQMVDSSVSSVDFSQTNLHTINQTILNNFEIYPLQTSVKSLNGKTPISFDIRNVTAKDKDRTFNFNNKNKHYAYVADGSVLEYNFNLSSTGTIMMKAFTDVDNDKQYFFEGKDNNNHNLGLYRNENGILCVDMNGRILTSTLTFKTNEWHTIGLSFDREVQSDSLSTLTYQKIRIYLDGSQYEFKELVFFNYSTLEFMIGRAYDVERIVSDLGVYETSHSLYGQIEIIATRNSYCDISTLNTLKEELKSISKIQEFDELGLLQKTDLHRDGESIISNTYSYKHKSDNKYCSKQISQETIKMGSTTDNRQYVTDALGNVTGVTDSTFGSHTYEYDYRGYLIKEDGKEYTYDYNGNITKAGTVAFSYDSTIKDRLVSVNGKTILYSSSDPCNPSWYDDKNYTFEGRRLKTISSSDNYGGEEISFEYNDQGLRVSKTQYYWYNDDRNPDEETTYYYYDGDKLISQDNNRVRLDFLYDENGKLYGLIKDNTTKYFYIRDFMQNILGIVDINGNIVVKYTYDAYGDLLSTTDTSGTSIGYYNPFRYKGYYFDNETNIYYCKSRYYVPEWRRWLNNDNVSFLEPGSINVLNLYVYCGNDPVNNYDPTGNFGMTLGIYLGMTALGAVIGAATSIITQADNNNWDLSKTNAGLVISDAIFGAINGTLSATGLGMFGSAVAGGLLNGVQTLVDTAIIGDQINQAELWISIGLGVVGGLIPGGVDAANLDGRYSTATTKLLTVKSPNKKAMYEAQKLAVNKALIKGISGFTASTIGSSGVSYFLDLIGAY